MYDYGQKVYVKSHDSVGTIIERGYVNRRAYYLVSLGHGYDYLTGPDDLRAADTCCDGCGRWLPNSSFNGGSYSRDGEYERGLVFCFLCTRS